MPPAEAAVALAPTRVPVASPVGTGTENSTSPLRELLSKLDFTPALQTVRVGDKNFASHAQNGFFGPDHYRIEMAFTEAWRDAANPAVYHLRGLDRYKRVITPFAGTLTLTQVVAQPDHSAQDRAELISIGVEEESLAKYMTDLPDLYTAKGDFVLVEDSSRRNAGTFRGRFALDFQLDPHTKAIKLQGQTIHSPAKGGLIKYEGTWTNAATKQTKPVVWVEDIFGYAQHVLNNFTVGEREVDFNPKYARLGWNSYWENTEWWDRGKKTAEVRMRPILFAPPVIIRDSSQEAEPPVKAEVADAAGL